LRIHQALLAQRGAHRRVLLEAIVERGLVLAIQGSLARGEVVHRGAVPRRVEKAHDTAAAARTESNARRSVPEILQAPKDLAVHCTAGRLHRRVEDGRHRL
jgi:hypothetical protein